MKDDPCYRCPLPDCDERSPRCLLRKLANSYTKKRQARRRDEITPAELDANARVYSFWLRERQAEASEGGRPLRKPGYHPDLPIAGRKGDCPSAGVGRPGSERGAP